LELMYKSDFQISEPQSSTHYAQGNGDMLNIMLHKYVRLAGVTVSDILDSDHLPNTFHIMDM